MDADEFVARMVAAGVPDMQLLPASTSPKNSVRQPETPSRQAQPEPPSGQAHPGVHPASPTSGKHRKISRHQLPDCMQAFRLHLSTGQVQVSDLAATRALSAGHANGIAEPQKEAPAPQRKASAGQEGPGLLTAARLDPQGKAKRAGSPKDAPAAGTLNRKLQWLVLLAVGKSVTYWPKPLLKSGSMHNS